MARLLAVIAWTLWGEVSVEVTSFSVIGALVHAKYTRQFCLTGSSLCSLANVFACSWSIEVDSSVGSVAVWQSGANNRDSHVRQKSSSNDVDRCAMDVEMMTQPHDYKLHLGLWR